MMMDPMYGFVDDDDDEGDEGDTGSEDEEEEGGKDSKKRKSTGGKGKDEDDEDDDEDAKKRKKKKPTAALDYESLMRHGLQAQEIAITVDPVEEKRKQEQEELKRTAEQLKAEAEAMSAARAREAIQSKVTPGGKEGAKGTLWKKGKRGKNGETPAETWAREQAMIRSGMKSAGGGMQHLAWTAEMSMEEVKMMRSGFD